MAEAGIAPSARAVRLADLIAEGRCCDVSLVVPDGQRLPAVRAVVASLGGAAADAALAAEIGGDFSLPVSIGAGRAALSFACGSVPEIWRSGGNRPNRAEVREAARALGLPDLEPWWNEHSKEDSQDSGDSGRKRKSSGAGRMGSRMLLACSSALTVAAVWSWRAAFSFNMQQGGFFMDDAMIKKNLNVVEELDWRRLIRTDYWGLEMFQEDVWTHKSFRPLTVLSFRLNYWLHTFDSTGFHVTNLALHAAASALLGLLGFLALGLPAAWALLLAALFAAHPVHTENVLYIVGRADLLCWLLTLMAALVYAPCVMGRSGGPIRAALRLLSSTGLLVAAGLCKETGFCFFGLLAGWEILRGLTGRASWRRNLRLVALLALGVAACYGRFWWTGGTAIERMDPHSNPIAASEDGHVRRLSYALVHGLYVKLMVWPLFLCYDYSLDAVPLVRTLEDPRLLLPCAAYLFAAQLLVVSLWPLRGGRYHLGSVSRPGREGPVIGCAVLLLSFVPMANVLFPVGTVIGERLLYVPSGGLLTALVCLARLWASTSKRGRAAPAMLLLAAGAAFAYLTAQRVPDWGSMEAITVADGLKQAQSSRVQFNFANIQLQAKKYDEALFLYNRAISIDPQDHDALPFYHAGQILFYQGQHQEAERYLNKAVSSYFSPLTIQEEEIWHDYGLALYFAGKPQEAVANLERSLAINPTFTKSWNNLACVCALGAASQRLGQEFTMRGLQSIEQAIAIDSTNILYWRNAAVLLLFAGDRPAAENAWARVQAMSPDGGGDPPQDCTWEFYFR